MGKTKIKFINGKVLRTPAFIPALTTIKNIHSYIELFDFLNKTEISIYLISAYDIYYQFIKQNKISEISSLINKERIILMDSGAFEIFYYNKLSNGTIDWNTQKLEEVANELNPNILVSLDYTDDFREINQNQIFQNYLDLFKSNRLDEVYFEIVLQDLKLKTIEKFTDFFEKFEKLFGICIPEKKLGGSINSRLKKLNEIIKIFKRKIDLENIFIHLLGCSDPLAIEKYVDYNVDLFDGVHWQDSIIDPNSKMMTDYSRLLEINCECTYCNKFRRLINSDHSIEENYYNFYALSHNIRFYDNLMENLREGM